MKTAKTAKAPKKLSYQKRKSLTGYVFLSPWIFASIFLLYIPLIFSLMLSFSDLLNVTRYDMKFVGIENFRRAFVVDTGFLPMFIGIVKQSLIQTPMIIIFSLIIGIIVNKKIKFRGFFRSVFFFPVILGTGFVMAQLLGQKVDQQAIETARGIILPSQVQSYIGPEISAMITNFLGQITMVMWKSGVQIIIILAGMQGISPALYEAAKIDSATEWEIFWKITLPMISPVLLLNIVYTIIDSFTDSQNPIVSYLERTAFTDSNFEYAAAMGWMYFLFVFIFIGIVFLVMRPFIAHVSDS